MMTLDILISETGSFEHESESGVYRLTWFNVSSIAPGHKD